MKRDGWALVFIFFGSIFCIFYIFTFVGCAKRVVYKEVKIPVRCDLEIPTKPKLSGDLVSDFSKALQHSEVLEKDLFFCIKGEYIQ